MTRSSPEAHVSEGGDIPVSGDEDDLGNLVESKFQLQQLADEGELNGRQIAGFSAAGLGLREADLDHVVIERVDLQGADFCEARLESSTLRQCDLRTARWEGGLWNRVRASDCDLTELDLTGAELIRCEMGPLRAPRIKLHRAKVQGCSFTDAELYGADFSRAVVTKSSFSYSGTESLSRVNFRGAALINVSLRGVNLYGADFTNALLVRCNLSHANLCGVELEGAHFIDCDTTGAELD